MAGGGWELLRNSTRQPFVVKATSALVLITDTHRHTRVHTHSHVKEKNVVLNSSGPRQMAVVDRIWREKSIPCISVMKREIARKKALFCAGVSGQLIVEDLLGGPCWV